MKRLLIAYDGSAGAESALLNLAAAGLPDRAEAKVLSLADVWLPPESEAEGSIFPDRTAAARITARQHALEALEKAKIAGNEGAEKLRFLFPHWLVVPSARADSPAWGILAEARRWPADLIVLGSHGRSPFQKFFLGSVSYKVAAEAPCSVRIYKPKHGQDDSVLRLLLAIDGSPDSKAMAGEVLAREWPSRTEFHLVSVLDPKARTAALRDDDSTITEDWIPSMLAEHAGKFQLRQFNAYTHIFEGDVKTVLLENADKWGIDCLFLGARGVDHRDRLYLGTSASALATRAHCTVEIVRPRALARNGNARTAPAPMAEALQPS